MTSGVRLPPGSGAWRNLSDRNLKTGVARLDGARVLAKLDALPVSEWSYTSERGVRHVGPMAQDFYAAFGVGFEVRVLPPHRAARAGSSPALTRSEPHLGSSTDL
jgi:hypothetical protein